MRKKYGALRIAICVPGLSHDDCIALLCRIRRSVVTRRARPSWNHRIRCEMGGWDIEADTDRYSVNALVVCIRDKTPLPTLPLSVMSTLPFCCLVKFCIQRRPASQKEERGEGQYAIGDNRREYPIFTIAQHIEIEKLLRN